VQYYNIQKLSLPQQQRIYSFLEEMIVLGSQVNQITQDVKEYRLAKGKICPHCGAKTVSRNGKYNGKQRYICKSCRKTFTDFTNSATYKSKKSMDMWLIYAKCMINGYSIRKCTDIVGINGFTTKYINNYMYWFKWVELFENDKEAVKAKNFMVQCNVAPAFTKTAEFRERKPMFV